MLPKASLLLIRSWADTTTWVNKAHAFAWLRYQNRWRGCPCQRVSSLPMVSTRTWWHLWVVSSLTTKSHLLLLAAHMTWVPVAAWSNLTLGIILYTAKVLYSFLLLHDSWFRPCVDKIVSIVRVVLTRTNSLFLLPRRSFIDSRLFSLTTEWLCVIVFSRSSWALRSRPFYWVRSFCLRKLSTWWSCSHLICCSLWIVLSWTNSGRGLRRTVLPRGERRGHFSLRYQTFYTSFCRSRSRLLTAILRPCWFLCTWCALISCGISLRAFCRALILSYPCASHYRVHFRLFTKLWIILVIIQYSKTVLDVLQYVV